MSVRRTFVCRPDIDARGNASCSGGGFWTDDVEGPAPVHRCGKRLTELAPTRVTDIGREVPDNAR